jgi:hypothetical protein
MRHTVEEKRKMRNERKRKRSHKSELKRAALIKDALREVQRKTDEQRSIILLAHIISTDEDPGLRIESFAVINLHGVSTNKTIIYFIAMQTYKELIKQHCFKIL